jgi:predicted phosphodiesterase
MTHENDHAAPTAVPEVTRQRRPVVVSRIALALVAVLAALTFGVTTAEAEATLGPHLARYEMTVDHEVTVDLGPLGTIVIDSPLPFVLGARVVVQEIPAELSALDQSQTIDALSGDLQRYVQFFGAPGPTIEAAARALALDAVKRALAALGLVALAWWVGRWALGATRRAELSAELRRHGGVVAGGVALTLLVVGAVTASSARAPGPAQAGQASSVFDGTPLEGARITGRLAGLVDTYGAQALDAYRENERYYAAAADAVEQAWHAELAREEAAAEIDGRRRSSGETVTALVVSDLHCNVGMATVIARVASLAGVDMVLNAGDSTVDGTAVESYCVQAFADAVPDGVPYVIADGNHDSAQTAATEKAVGAIVLAGHVVEVDGIRILGDSDPNETRIGEGTRPKSDETVVQEGQRLADVACTDGDVDLLLIHTPSVGDEALRQGCVPTQISGHLHTRYGPMRIGDGVRYISSSTAGALLDEPTVGPLRGTAELTLLHLDAETRRVVDYRLVRVRPSGEAIVGPLVGWPTAFEPEPAPHAPI